MLGRLGLCTGCLRRWRSSCFCRGLVAASFQHETALALRGEAVREQTHQRAAGLVVQAIALDEPSTKVLLLHRRRRTSAAPSLNAGAPLLVRDVTPGGAAGGRGLTSLSKSEASVFCSLWGLFFDSFFHHFFRSTFLPLKFTTCDQKAPTMTSKGPHFGHFWWVSGIHGNLCFTIVKHRFLRFWEVPFHDFCVTFFMVSTFSHSI